MVDEKKIVLANTTASESIRERIKAVPVAALTSSPLWVEARWVGTTFRYHPTSEIPPVMGLVFEKTGPALELFRKLEEAYDHKDRLEEIRISIIEGSPPGQRFGYTVHICPDPDALAMYATAEDIVINPTLTPFLGRWSRFYPVPGSEPMLPRFKDEFGKHGEFMLAPVTRRADGQSYLNPKLGLIKQTIQFRELTEITEDDIDAGALLMPRLVPPCT
jgi:hypothetical protein